MTRRDFLTVLFSLLTVGCTRSSVDELRAEYLTLDIQHVRQLITVDPTRARRVMFQADESLSEPAVELRCGDEIKLFPALDCSFTDDDHLINQYSVSLAPLEPDTTYRFRAVDGDRKSDWHELVTSVSDRFKALIFPDSQCADYRVWASVAAAAIARHPDAEFFTNLGDLVDNGEDWTQWRAWFDGASFIDRIPFAPVMGNHECYSREWTIRLPNAYVNYFDVPSNGSRDFDRYYYSFDWGAAHFIVLNTEWIETDEFIDGLRAEQVEWLRRDVSSSARRWRIVLMHRDVLQYRINGREDRAEGFSEAGTTFMPLFDELGIDLVLTGHLHTYRNRGRIFNFERSPRGALYILTGIAGDVRYPGLWIDHALDEVVAPQPETDNYLTLEVSAEELFVRCFLPDGTELDRAVLRAPIRN